MFPRWLGWIFLLFLGYVLYVGDFLGAPTPQAERATPFADEKIYPKLAEFTDKNRWLDAVNPDRISEPRWREITPGSGKGAVCGETLQVKITRDGKEDIRKFTLGNAPHPILNEALMHMQEGAVREVSAPPSQFFKNPPKEENRMIRVTVERLATQQAATK